VTRRGTTVAGILLGAVAAAILAGVLVSALRTPGAPQRPAIGRPLPSRPAGEFVDSVGVNVHMTFYDTAYARFDVWSARLRELGVRHVRDGLVVGDPTYVERYRTLAAQGVRASLIVGETQRPAAESVALAAGPLRPVVEALEGPNEPDLGGAPGWQAATEAFMAQLHDALARTPALRVPLLGPSFADAQARGSVGGAGRLWQVENLHSYAGGRPPETRLPDDIAAARGRSPGAPIVVTEMGYHDATSATVGQPAVSESTAADYVPRSFLEAFAAGARRTYLYELADEKPDPAGRDPEQHFGLLHQDGTPKPAFVALQRLLASIGRSPGGGQRRPVAVRSARDIRSLLLDRRDGSRALVLWRRGDARVAGAAVGPDSAQVRFAGDPAGVRVEATDGRPVRSALHGDTLRLSLGAGAVVVSFR
jgi:hypothetical protein